MFKNGDKIGQQYQVIKCIGAGSFGTIYLGKYFDLENLIYWNIIAEHLASKKYVAIKTEPVDAQFPLIIYEANVTLILHGMGKPLTKSDKGPLAIKPNEPKRNEKGFAKVYSYG